MVARASAVSARRLVVLASGSGTTLQALLDASDSDDLGASVVAVGADRDGAVALQRAAAAGIPTFVVKVSDFPDRASFDDAVAEEIAGHDPDLLVLAGYMKLLGPAVIRRWPTVNTHPALLPAFPGATAVRDAIGAGATTSGATVHWVDEGMDTGEVIAQVEVPILPGDDESTLLARIQAAERPLFVRTIRELARTHVGRATQRSTP
jgi:formyltetrahydrofolate-dependent phosphoribosylglycinamide formyltransferase